MAAATTTTFVSGAALAHLAYLVPRALSFPYHATVWTGGEPFVALTLFALWHFGVWQPTAGLLWTATTTTTDGGNSTSSSSNPFASLADESGEYVGYLGILSAIAVGSAAVALAVSGFLHVPLQRLVPSRRLFGSGRAAGVNNVPTAADWGALVLGVLVMLLTLLPYELTARFAPGGAPSLAALLVGALVPPVATCLGAIVRRMPAATVVHLTIPAAALAVPTPILVYYGCTFDFCWLLAATELCVVALGAAVFALIRPRIGVGGASASVQDDIVRV